MKGHSKPPYDYSDHITDIPAIGTIKKVQKWILTKDRIMKISNAYKLYLEKVKNFVPPTYLKIMEAMKKMIFANEGILLF